MNSNLIKYVAFFKKESWHKFETDDLWCMVTGVRSVKNYSEPVQIWTYKLNELLCTHAYVFIQFKLWLTDLIFQGSS